MKQRTTPAIVLMEDAITHTVARPECNDEGCICHGLEHERAQVQGGVECEACGIFFYPQEGEGYYEEGEYAYCSECCHW